MAITFTNQATLSYNGGAVQSNIAAGAIEGVLSVSKNTATQEYHSGDTLTYVVSIINNSDAAVAGLSVTDDLGAYLFDTGSVQPLSYVESSVQYYSDGELMAAPSVSTVNGLVLSDIDVPANGSAILVYQAQVNEFAPTEIGGVIENTVTVTGTGVCDVVASESVAAAESAVLAVLKSVTPIPVAENGELTYTFQLQNAGNTALEAADNAIVTDTFDPLLHNLSVTLNGVPLTAGVDYTYNETTGLFTTANGVITIPAASFTQDPATGAWTTQPGTATLTVSGTVGSICDLTVSERT